MARGRGCGLNRTPAQRSGFETGRRTCRNKILNTFLDIDRTCRAYFVFISDANPRVSTFIIALSVHIIHVVCSRGLRPHPAMDTPPRVVSINTPCASRHSQQRTGGSEVTSTAAFSLFVAVLGGEAVRHLGPVIPRRSLRGMDPPRVPATWLDEGR